MDQEQDEYAWSTDARIRWALGGILTGRRSRVVIDGNVHCMQVGTRRSLGSQVPHVWNDSAYFGAIFCLNGCQKT
jgi:hypothetical protein